MQGIVHFEGQEWRVSFNGRVVGFCRKFDAGKRPLYVLTLDDGTELRSTTMGQRRDGLAAMLREHFAEAAVR